MSRVYYDYHWTFYCRSSFDTRKNIIHDNGYVPSTKSKREYRVEFEHVVPAHAFGQSFNEWRNGDPDCVDNKGKPFKGRKCAEKMNEEYRYMQSDLHNLRPSIGMLNGLRSNYSYAMIPGPADQFGSCEMKVKNRKAEPPPYVRGDIARTYYYMDSVYKGRGILSQKNVKLFEAWNREDPVDEWECERDKRIAAIQGNTNPYVSYYCQE